MTKKEAEAHLAHLASDDEAFNAVDSAFYSSVFEVARGSIDRTRAGADTVQKAAAAIGTIYTTLVAAAFSVTDNPLPARAILPAFFLGVALVTSTAYLAYLTRAEGVRVLTPRRSRVERQLERARSLIVWTRRVAEHNSYLLRVSVLALGAALLFLPAPFISFQSSPPLQTVPWPEPSTRAGEALELREILYQAQVDEAAGRRAAVVERADDPLSNENLGWWLGAVAFSVGVFAGPRLINRSFGGEEEAAPGLPPSAPSTATP